jgi:hemolysin activation/secretion protein
VAPEFELPPIPEAPPEQRERLSRGPTIVVHEFRVTGSTVFTPEEIAAVTAPYLNRPVNTEDLERLRQELTLLYVRRGYVNSGAILPDQRVTEGVVEYQIVEGRLTGIEIFNRRHFREHYLRSRLERAASTPLDVHRIEERLQILQKDDRIQRVNAQLVPGDRPGEAILRVRVEEENPFVAWISANNYESPSIGEYQGQLQFAHRNFTGNGDILGGSVSGTEGYQEYDGSYEIPVTRYDTAVGARYQYSTSDVIEEPFGELDIKSRSQTIALTARQPLYRTLNNDLGLSLSAEWRESRTYLLDEPFSFPPLPFDQDGESKIAVLRFGQEWTYQDLRQVIAVRSLVSQGLHLFGSSSFGGDIPDSQFLAWLGQLQWARRFDRLRGTQLVFRTDVQLAANPLMSLEQFELGGHSSVRGYRENFLVRDNGVVSSVEVRYPLFSDATGYPLVQLCGFYDYGRGWNTDRPEPNPKTITSAGAGIRIALFRRIEGNLYWGHAFDEVDDPDDETFQDRGFSFAVTMAY